MDSDSGGSTPLTGVIDDSDVLSFEEIDGYTPTSVYLPWERKTIEAIAENRDFDNVSGYVRFLIRQDVQLQIEEQKLKLISMSQ